MEDSTIILWGTLKNIIGVCEELSSKRVDMREEQKKPEEKPRSGKESGY